MARVPATGSVGGFAHFPAAITKKARTTATIQKTA
jgi:hypothetical protein